MKITLESKHNKNDFVFVSTYVGLGHGIVKDVKWQQNLMYTGFVYLVEFELGLHWFQENEIFVKGD